MCKKSAKPSHHFAIIKIILLYPTELQFNPDKFMVDGRQNGFHQVFCAQAQAGSIDAGMAAHIFTVQHIYKEKDFCR